MNVEFYHSVLCGHCFIMSRRMREIVAEYPEINIIHRGFPLRWDDVKEDSDFENKWEIANRIDEEKLFNIEGMKQTDFPMPTSRLPMIAIQAATLAGGNEWDLFDAFQKALYSDNQNIADEDVIADIIMSQNVDFDLFLKYYEDPSTEEQIKEDFKRAETFGLDLIPALVVEEEYPIIGTKRTDLAIKLLNEASLDLGISLTKTSS